MKKGATTIKLNGKEYKLSFNFSVIKSVQLSIKGLKVEQIFNGIAEQDFNIISELLYRGIKFNHSTFKREVIDELGFEDIETVFTAIGELFESALPKATEESGQGEVEGK